MKAAEQLKRELVLRKYSQSTVNTYESCLKTMVSKIGERPTLDQYKDFLIGIENASYHKQMVATIHKYQSLVLKSPVSLNDIPYPRKQDKLIEVLSLDEMRSLLCVIENRKHKAIVSLMYGCGLRRSEVLNLKIVDIDSSRMVINIRQAKGNKDRQIMLDAGLLVTLRDYVQYDKPTNYLFNGQYGEIYSASSINQFLKMYAQKAGIKKHVHAHLLRHCFAVHMIESGNDMSILQKLMGHSQIKTTQHYAKISTALISKVKSPLASLYS